MYFFRPPSVVLVVLILLAQTTEAAAPPRKVVILETRAHGFKPFSKALSDALASAFQYQSLNPRPLFRSARGAGGATLPEKLRGEARALGADLVIRLRVSGRRGKFLIRVFVDATEPAKKVFVTALHATATLDPTAALALAASIHRGDAPTAAAVAADHLADSLAAAQPDSEPVSPDEGSESEEGISEEYVEPTEALRAGDHYVPPDGRLGLVVNAGYASFFRRTDSTSGNGTPPHYEGALSPGFVLAGEVFPRRFSDGGGWLRDLGVFASFDLIFTRSRAAADPTNTIYGGDQFNLQAGGEYRHVFGNTPKAVALGVQLGIAVDAADMNKALPYPSTLYISPVANAVFELPIAGRYLVWNNRLGIMPYATVSSAQVFIFGKRSAAVGLNAASGFRSTFWRRMLFAEANAVLIHYWSSYKGTGDAGFIDSSYRELIVGFNISLGFSY